MSAEGNYLDNLLNTVESMEEMQSDEKLEISEKESDMEEISIDSLEMPESLDVEIPDVEMPDVEIPDLDLSDLDLPDIVMPDKEFDRMAAEASEDTGILDQMAVEETSEDAFEDVSNIEEPAMEEKGTTDADTDEGLQLEAYETDQLDTANPNVEELEINDKDIPDIETPEVLSMPNIGEELSLEDIEMPESGDEFKLEDLGMPADEPFQESELSIDGLDQAIQSETELQMAGELDINDLGLDNFGAEADDLALLDSDDDNDVSISMDDNLEDVLNMLDDDTELAEINDMLKKSDNNEPIQDDMMDLLHQMADDEAASVNAGLQYGDDEDDGVPLPEIPKAAAEPTERETRKKVKKVSEKKAEKANSADGTKSTKEPGKLGKFFNLLTEELVPEPTEEELAAEKEAKAAKKQENLTKKEEEKLAKKEAKKAKAEEKAAANKVKQDAAAQKKKEKQAKKEAKKAKAAEEGTKKRIPPKKIAVVAAFGVSVGGAVVIATNILSTQGFLQTARNAYYDGDYKTVYEATYGMELDDSENDGLIKAKSEVIFKVQRRYDSYQTNVKMGREVEALDALLRGIEAYDTVNADAEKYGVLAEVDAVKADILNVLESKYGLDEAEARNIISNQDALSYTIALNDVIAGN